MSQILKFAVFVAIAAYMSVSAAADDRIEGRVDVGGAPISGAEVTAWLAGPGAPRKLVAATTDADGAYELTIAG